MSDAICNKCQVRKPWGKRKSCQRCFLRARKYRQKVLCQGYAPLDEILERPPVRLLRALQHWGWVDSFEWYELSGLPEWTITNDIERQRHMEVLHQAAHRLVADRLVERRTLRTEGATPRGGNAYRITPKGRAWLAEQLKPDTSVCSDAEAAPEERAA